MSRLILGPDCWYLMAVINTWPCLFLLVEQSVDLLENVDGWWRMLVRSFGFRLCRASCLLGLEGVYNHIPVLLWCAMVLSNRSGQVPLVTSRLSRRFQRLTAYWGFLAVRLAAICFWRRITIRHTHTHTENPSRLFPTQLVSCPCSLCPGIPSWGGQLINNGSWQGTKATS